MVNSVALKQKIRDSGYKIGYIANELGLSRQGLYDRINGKSDFRTTEVSILCSLIGVESLQEKENIFFA